MKIKNNNFDWGIFTQSIFVLFTLFLLFSPGNVWAKPTTSDVSVTVQQDSSVTLSLVSTKDRPTDRLSYYYSSASHGAIRRTDKLSPNLTYTPVSGYSGSDQFTYYTIDSRGQKSNTSTVRITIVASNHAPTADSQSITFNEDDTVNITLTGQDADGDSLSYAVSAQPAHGSLTGSGNQLSYTPSQNYNGSDSFSFTVSDGKQSSSAAIVSLSITAVNDAPTAIPASISVKSGETAVVTFAGSDVDNDSLTALVVQAPVNGSLSTVNNNQANYVSYRGFVGTDSFQFQMSDGKELSDVATITISITSAKTETGNISLQILEDVSLNRLLGLSDMDGNTMKLMDSCQINNTIYAAGIQTADIAVKKDGKVSYVDTGITDFIYKNIQCGDKYVFVSTQNEVVRIDTQTLQVTGLLDYSNQDPVYYSNLAYDAEYEKLFVSFIGEEGGAPRVLLYDADSLTVLNTFSIARSDMYINAVGDIVAVNTAGSNTVTIYDGVTFVQKSSVKVNGASFVAGTTYDASANKLWWFTQIQAKNVNLDNLNQFTSITSINHGMPSVDRIDFGGTIVALSCENCFDERENNTSNVEQGGVTVIDAATNLIVLQQAVPYKHKSCMVDDDLNEVILSNNEEDSVSVIDYLSGDIKIEDIGNGYEWSNIDDRGRIHLVNRLGGSTIETLDPENNEITSIDVAEWPVGLAYDQKSERLVTFNHLGNGFSFFDIDSIIPQITLNEFVDLTGVITTPDYDSLGDVAFDGTHQVAYGAIPELNQVVVFHEADNATQVIDLPYTGQASKGAGLINIAVYEPNQYLFVYYRDARTIYVYDGTKNYEKISEITPRDGWGSTDYPYSMFVEGNTLYVGPYAYDMETLTVKGQIQYGYRVIGIDSEYNMAILLGTESGIEYLYVVSLDDQSLKDKIELRDVRVTTANGVYDEVTGMAYIIYLQDADLIKVKVFE